MKANPKHERDFRIESQLNFTRGRMLTSLEDPIAVKTSNFVVQNCQRYCLILSVSLPQGRWNSIWCNSLTTCRAWKIAYRLTNILFASFPFTISFSNKHLRGKTRDTTENIKEEVGETQTHISGIHSKIHYPHKVHINAWDNTTLVQRCFHNDNR